ncbi:hypothetical protein FOL47_002402 [Perkinsus chesapeaki]|uniref:EF-hand domain-containing protein n=1 Tax=Perkinsus chesapeaki TaxID=330153 RepID=A0A7J6KQM0_PERCH|nr:hypothetical protein FOL47_002402 [Perkinsus chesapeaki]
MGRLFRVIDDDGDGKLNKEEFNKFLTEIGVRNDQARSQLFRRFDSDSSGAVDYDEFLRAIRGLRPPLGRDGMGFVENLSFNRTTTSGTVGKMNQRRRETVESIFEGLDCDGDGCLTAGDINCLNPSHHPDVRSGCRRPEEIFAEVMQVFDGNNDGKVTLKEWIE